MRILIIEDSRRLVANLFEYLEPRGHTLDAAPDGLTGLHLATRADYDVVVLDWMLPRLDGAELLRRLRQEARSPVPVIMLTARNELPDKIDGFRAGADDYLTKPFELAELEVRLEALAARAARARQQTRSTQLRVGDLTFDLATLETARAGQPLHLYPACRTLLSLLMQASPAAVTRERLETALWGEDAPSGDPLRSHIYDLRRAIDAPFATKLLHTLPRVGYRLAEPNDTADAT
jgi:DNA-binding response OmpR family regulator